MPKWTLNQNELQALEDLNDGLEDLENSEVYEDLCSAGLCVCNDGPYVLTVAGEAVIDACMCSDVDSNAVETVTVAYDNDELYDALVEVA